MKIYQWHKGNSTGRRLFDELLAKVANEEWDDEYLLLLIEYQKLYPASEKFEVFYAKYALAHGNTQLALAIARDGERKRRVSPVAWDVLRSCSLPCLSACALSPSAADVHTGGRGATVS